MERKELKKALFSVGYSLDSVKSMTSGRMKPNLKKAYELEDRFGIPVQAWRDIKSYIRNTTKKQCTNESTKQERKVS